jgi:transaldolase
MNSESLEKSLNKLEQLKLVTSVVADTGEVEAIAQWQPDDATTNPSLILKAVKSGEYQSLLDSAKTLAQKHQCALIDAVIVTFGFHISQKIKGLVSTEVDASLSFDTQASINKARLIIALYRELGLSKDRVLIKIASTWQGIQAAKVLELEGIRCNMTLLFAKEQAIACAQVNATLISPFVGRILDWYKAHQPEQDFVGANDPGVISVQAIYKHYKSHGYNTIVMGASFRNAAEIEALAGCDKLTISPNLLAELAADNGKLTTTLVSTQATESEALLCEADFYLAMAQNAMATEKLAHGISAFIKDQITLEALLNG